MKLKEASEIIERTYRMRAKDMLKIYTRGELHEAIRTIDNRKGASDDDKYHSDEVYWKLVLDW